MVSSQWVEGLVQSRGGLDGVGGLGQLPIGTDTHSRAPNHPCISAPGAGGGSGPMEFIQGCGGVSLDPIMEPHLEPGGFLPRQEVLMSATPQAHLMERGREWMRGSGFTMP